MSDLRMSTVALSLRNPRPTWILVHLGSLLYRLAARADCASDLAGAQGSA